jgi:hypothetical protein
MVIQNQGYRKDLNLDETPEDGVFINNLAGPGISNDLAVIQNNLRNTSSLSYDSLSGGFFSFPNNEFVYTNDDIVGVNVDVTVGSGTTLFAGVDYFVCNSNGETKFKLSETVSTAGLSTITVTSVSTTVFNFIRKDAVYQENIVNYIKPEIQDEEDFNYLSGNVNETFDSVSSNNETAKYFIGRKYKTDEDTETNREVAYEGTIDINDPDRLNDSLAGLSSTKSPGVFIGDTRAFSSDNNPWTQVGAALSTMSDEVSIAELNFADDIVIEGISATSDTSVLASSFTDKIPVVINGETYYLLLST